MVAGFLAVIAAGTVLLSLPGASHEVDDVTPRDALFTATSAATVTGLVVVDAEAWTPFGQGVLLVLIQVGGLGLMTVSSVVVVRFARTMGLRHRMAAQTESGAPDLGGLAGVVGGVVRWTLLTEGVVAVLLAAGFAIGHDEPLPRAAWLGLFHAVSAFNNAGFALFDSGLVAFVRDPYTSGVVSLAVVAGGLGFPVVADLRRFPRRPGRWTLHTKLTLVTTGALFALGAGAVLLLEWSNPGTLGPLDLVDKLSAAWFQGVTPRTAGFNTVDYGAVRETTALVTVILMFIGASSGSTGGGIKVTTFAVLGCAIWAEVRGRRDVDAFGRRISGPAQRQALAIALLGVAAVVLGTLALLAASSVPLSDALFEATSAFGTVGLSTGITGGLDGVSHVVLGVLMFVGRAGPITLAAALVLREREPRYRYPEERPLVG